MILQRKDVYLFFLNLLMETLFKFTTSCKITNLFKWHGLLFGFYKTTSICLIYELSNQNKGATYWDEKQFQLWNIEIFLVPVYIWHDLVLCDITPKWSRIFFFQRPPQNHPKISFFLIFFTYSYWSLCGSFRKFEFQVLGVI